jgi:hypothetical protein
MSRATYPLKLPISVKKAAERLAKQDGVSLNQWIAVAVAEKVGVSVSPNRFDEFGLFDRIAQRVPQFVHRNSEAMVEIDECVRRPQAFAKIFPRDDLPGRFHKCGQHQEWLFLQSYLAAISSQLSGTQIYFEMGESDQGWEG